MYNQKYHHFKTFYNHKYGFHINGPRRDAFEAVLRLKPRIVKTLDFSVDAMKKIRREIPDIFLIGRLAVSPQDFGQFRDRNALMTTRIKGAQRKGRDMAQRILREEVNKNIHHVNGKPIFNAWESLNEIFPESVDVDSQKLYDEYQVVFGKTMRAAGFEAIGMNFATGNFTGKQFVDNFAGTLETYKYLGFHEYDWPTMDRLHKIGLNEPATPKNIKDRVADVGEGRGNDGMWLCLRYRRTMFGGVRQKYGDKHTVIITECGMTQGVQGGHDVGPWASNHRISPDDYWKSLMWYNSEIMKDDYVMGACLFVTGAAGKVEWDTFEHLGVMMDKLAAFQKPNPGALKATVTTRTSTAAKPIPTISPKPAVESAKPKPQPTTTTRGSGATQPSVQPKPTPPEKPTADPNTITITLPKAAADYHSHYVLFPQRTGEWWYAAAREYLRKFSATNGENVRDALILRGGKGYTVTCINPTPETIAKIKKYSPGAKLDIIQAASPGELAGELKKRIARNKAFGKP